MILQLRLIKTTRLIVLASCCIFHSGVSDAQPNTLLPKGRVMGIVSDINANRVVNAKVIIEGKGSTTIAPTQEDGTYTFDLPAALYRISVKGFGFCPMRRAPFRLGRNTITVFNFSLLTCSIDLVLSGDSRGYRTAEDRYTIPFKEDVFHMVDKSRSSLYSLVQYVRRVRKGGSFCYSGVAPRGVGLSSPIMSHNLLTVRANEICVDKHRLRVVASDGVSGENGSRSFHGRIAIITFKGESAVIKMLGE